MAKSELIPSYFYVACRHTDALTQATVQLSRLVTAICAIAERRVFTLLPDGAFPITSIHFPWTKPKPKQSLSDQHRRQVYPHLPPFKQCPDSLFTGCDAHTDDANSMKKATGASTFSPLPSSSAAFSPPYCGAHDIEAATQGQLIPYSAHSLIFDVDSPPHSRSTTWPSLHRPPPHAWVLTVFSSLFSCMCALLPSLYF
ncbi:hypothetical protein B0H19DRAFT_1270933 [Mycena capillaripes]|nr:hypothetical protein B0H19DRAFT_1270933 [Mycena capillaripes]